MRPSARLLAPCALLALVASASAETHKVPADHATIADAVAAAADGDTIIVSKGTYRESVSVSVPNLELIGKNAVIDAEYAGPCLQLLADGISVTGFTLVNGTDGVFGSGANISISKCTITSCSDNGIEVEGAPVTISKNTVTGCNSDGILYLHSLPGTGLIEKNVCRLNDEDGIQFTGDDTLLSKNTCEGNEGNGIEISIASLSLFGLPLNQPVLIEKNDCRGNEDDGLQVFNDTLSIVRVQANDLTGNCDHGLDADGNGFLILSNHCDDNRDNGMDLFVGTSVVSGNSASGNAGDGIALFVEIFLGDGSPPGSGDGNAVSDNTCKDNAGDGIRLGSGDANTLDGNTCKDNLDDGIDVDSTAATNTVVDDNTCNDNAHEGLDNGGTGSVLTGNTCKKNGHGVGPDIAGLGDLGLGTLAIFTDNVFSTGGEAAPSRLDDGEATGP